MRFKAPSLLLVALVAFASGLAFPGPEKAPSDHSACVSALTYCLEQTHDAGRDPEAGMAQLAIHALGEIGPQAAEALPRLESITFKTHPMSTAHMAGIARWKVQGER